MKAGIYLGKEQVEVRELETPVVGDDDVLIQNMYSSVCGTDVAVYLHGPATGHKVDVGGEFGHETVSRVVAVGKNVTEFKVGERVYPYPLYAKNDTKRAGTLGGFSEYILCPQAKRNHSLYPVREEISDRVACLIEPFTVGGHAAKCGNPKPGETAVVFGCGTIGIAAAIMLQYKGVEKVMICDLSDYRLKIAREMGFAVCNTGKEDFYETAKAYFGEAYALTNKGINADIWLDAAGAESILDLFMQHGKIASRYVIVAVNKGLRQIDLLHLTYSSKSIAGAGGYTPEDVTDVMNIMASGRWNIESIITQEFELDKLDQAIRTAADAEHAFNVTIRF
jgi:2-desacetyl-2-hydroxyethyl bacteriochlorophyllide A dehydrogenase